MKILQINTINYYGSTGKIAQQIRNEAINRGYRCVVAHRYNEDNIEYDEDSVQISSWWDCHVHNRLSTLTWLQGCFSAYKTRKFLKKVKEYNPDIIHLHNLHGSYINHKMLFNYLKKYNGKVVWTLHDCWAFTGYCPYFSYKKCDKWRDGCYACPLHKDSKNIVFDTSGFMWKRKKEWFTGVKNLTIVTPSKWLAELTKQSFLKGYPVKVINNGIDLSVFKPTESDFRKKHNVENKFIVLGVAFDWGVRKGLDVFVNLAKMLDDRFQIVLVGTNEETDKQLPENIISIHRTQNQQELAEIYTAADVFANPTREDNFPTVNMEALACGTPVVTFNTGGSPESISEKSGTVVDCEDTVAMKKTIIEICLNKVYNKNQCINRAGDFDKDKAYAEYVDLYERSIRERE